MQKEAKKHLESLELLARLLKEEFEDRSFFYLLQQEGKGHPEQQTKHITSSV